MGLVIQPTDRRLGQMVAGSANGIKTAQTQQAQVVSTAGGTVVVSMGAPINNTPSGTPGPVWAYEFSTSTANEDPGSGKLAFDSSTYSAITAMYVDWVDLEGGVVQQQLMALPVGATIQVASGSRNVVFTIASAPVNGDNYVTLPVAYVSSDDTPFSSGVVVELMGTAGITRVGAQFFDQGGILIAQLDQFGWHGYVDETGSGPAVYAGEVLPSGWTPLTLESGVSYASGPRPAARFDPGGVVRLCGQLYNDSGSTISAGTALAALPLVPSGLYPPGWTVETPVAPSGAILSITSTLSIGSNLAAGGIVALDGVTYGTNYAGL